MASRAGLEVTVPTVKGTEKGSKYPRHQTAHLTIARQETRKGQARTPYPIDAPEW